MSAVLERETIPVPDLFGDREPFELPQANEDIKTPRYLFAALNLISPQVARERPHMAAGGLNVYNPCLNQSMDFIRRGRITPLLTNQHVPIPVEEANTDNAAYFSIPTAGDSLRLNSPFEAGSYMGYPAYPGQQIVHILEGAPNIDGSGRRVGIVEITALKGHDYQLGMVEGGFRADPELWKIQRAIFPDYPNLPEQLVHFTEMIRRAFDSNVGVVRDVAGEMLQSCTQGESWAIWSIEQVHQAMVQASAKGYIHPYEEIDLVILAQLGRERQDEHFKRMAQQSQQIDPIALLNAVRQGSIEDRKAFEEMLLMTIRELKGEAKPETPSVDGNTMQAAPVDDKEAMMATYLRDLARHGVAKTRAAAADGAYGDLHHKTRERLEREFAETQVSTEPGVDKN